MQLPATNLMFYSTSLLSLTATVTLLL